MTISHLERKLMYTFADMSTPAWSSEAPCIAVLILVSYLYSYVFPLSYLNWLVTNKRIRSRNVIEKGVIRYKLAYFTCLFEMHFANLRSTRNIFYILIVCFAYCKIISVRSGRYVCRLLTLFFQKTNHVLNFYVY
jgi:hypothetical protein